MLLCSQGGVLKREFFGNERKIGFGIGFGLLRIFFEGTEDSGDEIETFHSIIDFIVAFEGEVFGSDFRKVPQG